MLTDSNNKVTIIVIITIILKEVNYEQTFINGNKGTY